MDRQPRIPTGKKSARRFYRPMLERLEDRLPPGDLLGTTLLSSEALLHTTVPAAARLARAGQPALPALKETARAAVLPVAPALPRPADALPLVTAPRQAITTSSAPIPSAQRSGSIDDLVSAVLTGGAGFLAGARASAPSGAAAAPAAPKVSNAGPTETPRIEAPAPPTQEPSAAPAAPQKTAAPPDSGGVGAPAVPAIGVISTSERSDAVSDYGQLPLSFEANRGQTDSRVQFLSRGNGYALFLTSSEAVLSLHQSAGEEEDEDGFSTNAIVSGTVVRMEVVGAREGVQAVGRDERAGKVNYFRGDDPSLWQTDVPTYGRVEFPDVYAGIDLVYYGNQRQLEYDFVVEPGADPGAIALRFTGAEHLSLDEAGNLVLDTAGGQIVQQRPILYQEMNGARQEVAGSYALQDDGQVGFAVGDYDTSRALVIDPVLSYSTYLGGASSDFAFDVAAGGDGSAYLTGQTESTNFPTTAGAFQTMRAGSLDVFVTKVNPAGTGLVYSTYLGGSSVQRGNAIAVDADGNAYIAGRAQSTNYPTTVGALQRLHGGSQFDAFVTKLNASGNGLAYSTYLGGLLNDSAFDLVVDADGNAHVTGGTQSPSIPITNGAWRDVPTALDAYYIKLNNTGSAALYGTYFGGEANDRGSGIGLDAAGNAYVVGRTDSFIISGPFPVFQPESAGGTDGFIACFNPHLNGSASLLYASFIGGSTFDSANAVALDAAGNAYVVGVTQSANFPLKNPFQSVQVGFADAFVLRVNPGGGSLGYSTFLGGGEEDRGFSIAVNAVGQAHVTGFTSSTNFPTLSPIQATLGGGRDAFVTKFNAAGTGLIYSTYLGGSEDENLGLMTELVPSGIALDAAGNAYVTGRTGSTNFPTLSAFQPTSGGLDDAFLTKLVDNVPLLVTSFTATSSGFIAQFNRPFDVAVLNLYDTQTGGLGPADVALVGATSGAVNGSLVLDASGTRLTFVGTGGALAPDTYTVTFRSAANGFKEATGGLLLDGDGNGTRGDSFSTSFTVSAVPALTVSVPDFSRGPNQPVNVPATAARLPLRLSNGAGVTRVTLTLRYNPSLLSVTGAQLGTGVPGGANVALDTSTPGRALLTFNTPALAAGAINFVTLVAQVQSGAAIGSSHVLAISNLAVSGAFGGLGARADDGVHAVAFFGDATGNGSYTSADASRIQRVATGLDSGFAAYVRTSPVIIADITGNGRIDSTDVTRVLQEAVGIDRAEIPPLA